MSERQSKYTTRQEVAEAMEMLGKGYHEPALEIETPRTITERRGGKLVESQRGAFVKIYTSFKSELLTIGGDDLKVWLYLALSVNRFTNDARPGLRKIAEETGLSVNTVRAILERLENSGLLEVEKTDGKVNAYHPSDYVSVRKGTVSKFDTVTQTVSNSDTTVSKNGPTVSSPLLQNAQLEELEEPEERETPAKNIFRLYEENIGVLTPMIADQLEEAEKTYPFEWIRDAIQIAVTNNKRAWRYCASILKRWQAEGKDDGRKPEPTGKEKWEAALRAAGYEV